MLGLYREYKQREAYLMPISDPTMQIIGDSRVRAACLRTNCLFFVQNRICSRRIRGSVVRCCIFEVRGSTRMDIDRFNKLMENYFSQYTLRKKHDTEAVKARLEFNEWTPDNTKLFSMGQRFGVVQGELADMRLQGPCGGLKDDMHAYHTGLMNMIEEMPRSAWMSSKREKEGLYTPAFGSCIKFQPVLFRPANKNKTYKGRSEVQLTTEPLPKMNYFSDPDYMDRLIDPVLTQTLREKEARMEAERHSHKTMKISVDRHKPGQPNSGKAESKDTKKA